MKRQRRLRRSAAPVRALGRVQVAVVVLVGLGSFPVGAQTTTSSTSGSTSSTASTSSSTSSTTAPSSTSTSESSSTTTQSSTTAPSTTAEAPTTSTTAPTSTAAGSPTTAASDPAAQQAERERIEAAEAAKAREVDAANAELGDVTDALRVLQERVVTQTQRVDYANERLASAEATVSARTEEVAAAEAEIDDLEGRLSAQAIRTFMGDEGDQVVLVAVPDPNEAVRRQTMLAQATQTDLDLVGELRAAREDLDVRRAEALDAVDAADAFRAEATEQLGTLERDREAQGVVTAAAEQRLDHLLAERAALAELGEEAVSGLPVADELADQLAASAPPVPPPSTVEPPNVITEDDIAYAGNGIYVHTSIVDNIRQLLTDAAAGGVDLAGGGYRSPQGQIAARRNNCGTSNYAIYEMPASQCSPPTARPGRSMHEQGLAIDFTHNGSLIRSRSGSGWAWLRDNAARYGLQNLPSEPWHWSVNGR
ncbi:MAG: M15 family metallopeptidase [Acidimicrobiia bacterium]|nr:M15 family metallopeptidase [Acidimicrobiia bacterium]